MRVGIPLLVMRPGRPSLRTLLVPVAVTCFLGALPADLAFWQSGALYWIDLAAWLIAIGVVAGMLAAIAGMLDPTSGRAMPGSGANALVLVLAFFNMLAHSPPGVSIVPTGLLLSAAVVVILPFTGWLGGRR